MSGLRPTASASSLASITNCAPSSFTLPSNTHSFPLVHPPPQQPSSPTPSPSTFSSNHTPDHPQGARDSSRRSKSETSSPPGSVEEIPSIQTQSPPSPHQNYNHRRNRTSNSPIANQFLMLSGERPPSPLTLTSTLAPPSVMPMTAAGVSASASVAKSTSSRRSPAATLKLSMLPSAPASMAQPPTSAATTAAASQMSATSAYIHHHKAYAHSLSVQHKLQLHQKEIISQATRATGIPPHLLSTGPMSPRLVPLRSPGPVTPLALEDNPGGFFASHAGALEHQQLSPQLAMVASGGAMQS